MRIDLRWRLMGSFLLVILLMGGSLYGYLTSTLDNYLVAGTREGLFSNARLARHIAGAELRGLRRDAQAMAVAIAGETRARVTFIDTQGEVLGDSDISSPALKEMENHLNRPEVQEAVKRGQGSAIRYSSTLRTAMLYVALPFQTAGREHGIVRLAVPLTSVEKAKGGLHDILGVSLVMATLVSLLLSYVLSSVTSRSLRIMAATAVQIGRGEFGKRIPVTSRDEVGELAGVMNVMALRIEEQLRGVSAEKNRLDTILRGMGEGLMVADADGVVTLVNPAFRVLFGFSEEVEGKPLIAITRHPALHDGFRTVLTTRNDRLEEINLHLDREKTVLTHWVPLIEEEEIHGVVAVFHDISDLKQLETVRRDFVANVSHELRTPVTVIKGYAEALLSGMLVEEPGSATRFVEIIHDHGERLATLINDLLSLSELESGELRLDLVPIPVASAVRHACSLLEQKASEKGITITLAGIDALPDVLADHGRIEQVFINLLDNAIKYTPGKGAVTISAHEEGDMVGVMVSDTGHGIPPKDLPRIFERFYRVDAARSREQGGTGLGLSIVKHIVQLHGGTVSVASTPGKGSTFFFTLRKA